MHQGATIDGELKHVAANVVESERPQLKLAAANEV
jgi:hypothetical protein